jgi:hypothetical protein
LTRINDEVSFLKKLAAYDTLEISEKTTSGGKLLKAFCIHAITDAGRKHFWAKSGTTIYRSLEQAQSHNPFVEAFFQVLAKEGVCVKSLFTVKSGSYREVITGPALWIEVVKVES